MISRRTDSCVHAKSKQSVFYWQSHKGGGPCPRANTEDSSTFGVHTAAISLTNTHPHMKANLVVCLCTQTCTHPVHVQQAGLHAYTHSNREGSDTRRQRL